MSSRSGREQPASVVEFAAKGRTRDQAAAPNDLGNGILALLEKAAETANADCARAMDLAHKLSFQLRAAEERARELEAEANHFRERAATAENWLTVIHNGVQQTFFQNGKNSGSNGHA
jgi:hypothetical protein